MPTIYKNLTVNDAHTDTIKVTTGIFNGGAGTLAGSGMYTASISSSNAHYFYTVTEGTGTSAVNRFDVAYGNHSNGGGSSTDYRRSTEAVYKQFANMILPPDSNTNPKFNFPSVSASVDYEEDDIYIISIKKDSTKDRLDGKWTLLLSGSDANGSGSMLSLTNYTSSIYQQLSSVGGYYKIISGAAGVPATASGEDSTVYGHFYPELSSLVLSANRISESAVKSRFWFFLLFPYHL